MEIDGMIEFKNISKSFKADFWAKPFFALENVSFRILEGEVIGFLGANGAGKTTSLKILMNFIRQSQGEIIFSKSLGTKKREIFKNIGYLPERPYFYPYLTGRELTEYLGRLNELSQVEISQKIKYWFPRLQLDHALDRKIRGYSKGMLQRLGFITALLHNPKIIILDEPLSGLDPLGRKEFKDIIRDLNKRGQTVFFSSHIVSDVEEVCGKVVVLEKGRKIYDGSVDKIISDNSPGKLELLIRGPLLKEFESSIKYASENHITYIIDENKKNDFLNRVYKEKLDLKSMTTIRPTLEEIVYQMKS